ncbi:hypothetical protein T484DRAFT_1610183 [Baffinella frigidus]|nr:hypothetical protein T484DRAFT_1610183 [Cryptophyta sp. CCMP2293]
MEDADAAVRTSALRILKRCDPTLHPTPYTLNPKPYTLHPSPYTLHPSPCTLHPSPCTLHPSLSTLHPTLYTLHLSPYTLHPACVFMEDADAAARISALRILKRCNPTLIRGNHFSFRFRETSPPLTSNPDLNPQPFYLPPLSRALSLATPLSPSLISSLSLPLPLSTPSPSLSPPPLPPSLHPLRQPAGGARSGEPPPSSDNTPHPSP